LQVLQAVPLPNPNPAAFRILLSGPADACTVQVYSTAMVRLASLSRHAALPGGWMELDARELGLANGTYFFEVSASRGDVRSLKPFIGRLVVLR
jgi:hypothetical protein